MLWKIYVARSTLSRAALISRRGESYCLRLLVCELHDFLWKRFFVFDLLVQFSFSFRFFSLSARSQSTMVMHCVFINVAFILHARFLSFIASTCHVCLFRSLREFMRV